MKRSQNDRLTGVFNHIFIHIFITFSLASEFFFIMIQSNRVEHSVRLFTIVYFMTGEKLIDRIVYCEQNKRQNYVSRTLTFAFPTSGRNLLPAIFYWIKFPMCVDENGKCLSRRGRFARFACVCLFQFFFYYWVNLIEVPGIAREFSISFAVFVRSFLASTNIHRSIHRFKLYKITAISWYT